MECYLKAIMSVSDVTLEMDRVSVQPQKQVE